MIKNKLYLFVLLNISSCYSSPSGCGGDKELIVTQEPQFIESPGYAVGNPYPGDLSCSWEILNTGTGPVEISFGEPFWLETGYTHCYDILTLTNVQSGEVMELCGEERPPNMTMSSDKVMVSLTTDSSNNYDGFRMYFWSSVEVPTTSKPITTTTAGTPPVTECPVNNWQCDSGMCISSENVCDNVFDCDDGSDEENCNTEPPKSCGKPAITPDVPEMIRVINGEEAVPHSWPWQISIQGQDNFHYCGGSLLSANWVLTAAHCANLVFIGVYSGDQVVVGMHDRMVNEPGKEIIKIAEKFLHPQYDSPDRANDLALLKLETPATIGDTVSPPCLPQPGDFGDDSSFPAGIKCVLSGWGKIGDSESEPGDEFGQPWRLRQTSLPLVTDEECRDIYLEGAGFTIQETMQCAGGDGHTACNGDSGGPMVCQQEDGYWYQVGIVSFGPAPCDASIPGVYTRVAGYVEWISDTINTNGGW